MEMQNKQTSTTKVNLSVDLVIFMAFLLVMAPQFTGLAIHEWLGLAFGGMIITHLLLHWQWIVNVTKRIFAHIPWGTRINYILNLLLFIDVVLIAFTGVMISREALPLLGIELGAEGTWRGLHTLAANLSILLTGLHVALHWQWIVNALGTYVVKPLLGRTPARPVATNAAAKLAQARMSVASKA